jgi:D-sedoheptulose 7-phosphate isomerase
MSRFDDAFDNHAALLASVRELRPQIESVIRAVIGVLESGHKILLCGNGGSAADAQHIATELTGRYLLKNRRPLPAIALTTDTSALTAIGNDFGFESVFSRQVEALAGSGDLVIGISTSGNSSNVFEALAAAKRLGYRTAALLGGDGGRIKSLADCAVVIPSVDTPRIQEMHILIAHILCDAIDQHFSSK